MQARPVLLRWQNMNLRPVSERMHRSGAEGPRRPVDVGFGPTEDGTWRSHVAGETAGSRPVLLWLVLYVKNMARFAIRHSFFAIRHRNIDIFDTHVTMQISGKETYFCVLR